VVSDKIWFDRDGIARLCGTFTKKDACGTRSGYSMGCRHDNCRKAGNEYNKLWKREKRGVMFHPVDNARAHLKWLMGRGAILRRVAEEIDVRYTQVWEIVHKPDRVWIDPISEKRILSLHAGLDHLFMTKAQLREIDHPHYHKIVRNGNRYGNSWIFSQKKKAKEESQNV
jgi:hypothetical protein